MTTRTNLERPAWREYVRAVHRELRDLPWRRRDDLMATVRESVGELPDDAVPAIRLGAPTEYARELRESAGLPPRTHSLVAVVRATRLRTILVTVAAVLVVILTVTALVARAHYQPVWASASFGASTTPSIQDDLVTDTSFYRYEPGKVVVTGFDVHNTGWATATVDGVDLVGSPNGPLAVRELHATTDEQLTGRWTLIPKVTHVDVPPGKTVYVFVVMKIVDNFAIGPPGGGTILDQPKLRIRVLGVHHVVTVPGNKIGILAQ